MKINASKVKFEDGHFPRDPTAQDDVLFGLTNRFYQLICIDQQICTLCMNFFLPTMSLKNIFAHSTIEKSFYPILLPYLHITTLTLSRLSSSSKLRKKSLVKPFQSNSLSFSSMSLSKFFVFILVPYFSQHPNGKNKKTNNT